MEDTTGPKPNTTTPLSITVIDYQAYTSLGCISVPFNILTIVVLVSDRLLLQKSALIFGLTIGNFLLALFLLTNGAYRLILLDHLQDPTTFSYCVSTVINLIYPLAFITEAAFLLLSGIERMLAIKAPHWFRKYWTDKNSWILTIVTLIMVFLTMVAGMVMPVTDRVPPTVICLSTAVFGTGFYWFLSGFTAFGGAMSALLTLIALIAGIRHIRVLPLASGETGRVRKQIQLTKSMVTVSCVDVALVVIPNIFSLLTSIGVGFPWWIRIANSSYTHGMNATAAFFAFLAFHSRFRKAAVKLLHVEKVYTACAKVFGVQTSSIQNVGQTTVDQRTTITTRNRTTNGRV